MACQMKAVCQKRFRKGEIACANCAQGKWIEDEVSRVPDIPDAPEDDFEEDLEEDEGEYAYVDFPDRLIADMADDITVGDYTVRGVRVCADVDGTQRECVIVSDPHFEDFDADVREEIDAYVDYYANDDEHVYEVLEAILRRDVEMA